jgi:hypothetical protein
MLPAGTFQALAERGGMSIVRVRVRDLELAREL